jgi:hypothetical protein
MPIPYFKGSLLLISLLNAKPIIGVAEVKFHEELCFRKSIYYLSYERNRVSILNSNFIKAAIVYAESYYPIYF